MAEIRTFQSLQQADLDEIRRLSLIELHRFLSDVGRPPGKYQSYGSQLLAICLIQGAAQHFADTRSDLLVDHEVTVTQGEIEENGYFAEPDGRIVSGVKDIDVMFFFRHIPAVPIPNRKHCNKRIRAELARLGQRRLDCMKKGVRPDILGGHADDARLGIIRRYVQETKHGKEYLSKKSVIGLHPQAIFGQPIWISRRYHRA